VEAEAERLKGASCATGVAVDWIPAASEPAAGSVRQKAPMISPEERRRR